MNYPLLYNESEVKKIYNEILKIIDPVSYSEVSIKKYSQETQAKKVVSKKNNEEVVRKMRKEK